MEDYTDITSLSDNSRYYTYQSQVNTDVDKVPSHKVIKKYIEENGMDYRYEDSPSPRAELRNRKVDNTSLGRIKEGAMAKH